MRERQAIEGRFVGKVAVVEQLCAEGAAVAFSGIEPELVEQAVRDLTGQGYQVAACCGDHAQEAFCRRFVREATGRWGRLHYLVNNAFSFIASGLGTEREAWRRSLEAGPVAYATMADAAAPAIRDSGGGAIVNVSSISARIAQPDRWTYNAAKGAVHTLTKCMALDLAP